MSYQSLDEIFASIDETRARLAERASGLSDAEERFKPSAEVWSAAEIVEHLATLEGGLQRLLGMMLKKAEEARQQHEGAQGMDEAVPLDVSLERFRARSRSEKFVAPENVRPRGDVSLSESLARLRASRLALHELRPRAALLDLSAVSYPHPIFGPLNFYEWLLFIGTHEDRHLAQIELLMQDPACPR